MKRIFAIILCSIIIFCHFVPVVSGQAAEVVIEQGIDFLYKSWDMIYSLINGGVIQTSPYQQIAGEGAALAAYYDDWGKNLLEITSWGFQTDPDSETPAISIQYPLDLGMTGNYYNNFVNEYLQYVQDANNGFSVPLTGNSLAAWNRFNNAFINRYLNAFVPTDQPVANPDQAYISYVNKLNTNTIDGRGFYWVEYTASNISTPINYTWCNYYSSRSQDMTTGAYAMSRDCTISTICTVDITGNGDFYSATLKNYSSDPCYWNNQFHVFKANSGAVTNRVVGSPSNILWSNNSVIYSGTLTNTLTFVSNNFRNINLYVNGELWAYAGRVQEPLVTNPDVIRNETGDIIGHDVMFPNQDLYVDLINWKTLVDDKIEEGADITFDDLIDAGVITDSNGDIITNNDVDTVFKKRDIAGVIAEELIDADASDFVPNAPQPPDIDPDNWNFPEFPLPDIDGELVSPKTTGLSVLARIINVTNQSLPSELITMFWGICITLVILGIIKILHK